MTLFFATNTETMLATKALRDSGVAARMIPTPQGIASSANLCLSIDADLETSALGAIRSANVPLGGVLK